MAKQRTAALGPWPAGINNSARDYRIPAGACLDALNVDFTDEGDAIGRSGYGQTTAIDSGHSLRTIGGKTFICLGTSLGVVTAINPLTVTTLRTGLDLLLPISYAKDDAALDEERRLLYVGLTRARKKLSLSWSSAPASGRGGQRQPSRFLADLR